jgi:hypothetical protein
MVAAWLIGASCVGGALRLEMALQQLGPEDD